MDSTSATHRMLRPVIGNSYLKIVNYLMSLINFTYANSLTNYL